MYGKNRVYYERFGYRVIKTNTGWVAWNTRKEFSQGHTHLCSFKSCKNAISFCIECRVPMKGTEYYLTSLQRLSTNQKYIDRLQERIEEVKKYGRYC